MQCFCLQTFSEYEFLIKYVISKSNQIKIFSFSRCLY